MLCERSEKPASSTNDSVVAIRVGALFLDLVAHHRALRDQRLAHALDEPLVRHPTHPFLLALRRARGCDV